MPVETDYERDQRINAFHIRNGADAVQLNGEWVYSSGATREINRMGALVDPPIGNPRKLARLRELYWEERVRRATNEFKDLHRELTVRAEEAVRWATASAPPPRPSKDELVKLEALRQAVVDCQAKLDEAREKKEIAKPADQLAREVFAEENRERNEAALAAVEAIKI